MSSITRSILRWGLISGLVLGGVCVIAGPHRVAAGLHQVRMTVQNVVDEAIDDPIVLRHQLAQLAEEYPDRIDEVQGEIGEVDHQIAELERDVDVSKRVVAMTTEDLHELKTLVARAETEAASSVRTVAIRFEGVRFDIDEAYNEGHRINSVRGNYQDRLATDAIQLKFLREQKTRLKEIYNKLEEEYSTYLTQLHQLDRQIDDLKRNERLIELTEQQQATLAGYERFGKVSNLKQVQAKLAEMRAKQQAQLERLEKAVSHTDYEDRARYDLDTDGLELDPFESIFEIDNETTEDEDEVDADKSMAWSGPIVIE